MSAKTRESQQILSGQDFKKSINSVSSPPTPKEWINRSMVPRIPSVEEPLLLSKSSGILVVDVSVQIEIVVGSSTPKQQLKPENSKDHLRTEESAQWALGGTWSVCRGLLARN